jgi:hypothetical protein
MLIKASMGPIRQQEETHRVERHAREAESVRISLATEDINMPCQGSTLLPIVATTGSISAIVCFLSLMEKPRYLKGKDP